MPQYQGVWTLEAQAQALTNQQWVTDPNFKNTTLLLQADGTGSGSQNQTFLDGSTNNFFITRNGNTTQGSFSPFSQAPGYWGNYFDGSSRLTIANNTAMVFGTGAFTVECWYYYTTSTTSGTAFITKGVGGADWQFYTSGANNYLSWSKSGTVINSSTVPIPNTWNHLVYVRDGSNNNAIFLNGTRIYSGTDTTNYSGTGSVYLASDGTSYYFTGYLSNARLVKGTAIYSATATSCVVPSTPLTAVSGTGLLTCQSNYFVDNSGNSLTVTVGAGTPSVQAFGPFAPALQWTPDVVGGSGYFDGTGDYLLLASNANLTPASSTYTFECWVYRTASGAMTIWDTAVNSGFYIHINGSNKVVLRSYNTADIITSSINAPVNAWFSIIVARGAANSTKMWINGSSTDGGSATDATTYVAASTYIGIYDNITIGLTGYISGMRFVKGSDVYGVSNATISVPTAPPTAITNTQLLLNYTNAGIYDGKMGNVLETVGNAQVSTSPVKYGSGSMYFNGTSDNLKGVTGNINAFGTGDFTVEMWLFPTAFATNKTIYSCNTSGASATGFHFGANASGQIFIYSNGGYAISSSATSGVLTINTWNHLAVVRTGLIVKVYVNGIAATSTWTLTTQTFTDGVLLIAIAPSGSPEYYSGYIDDLRITKGVARYIANFTPPQQALPRQ